MLERNDRQRNLDVRVTLQTDDRQMIFMSYRGYVGWLPWAHKEEHAGQPLDWTDYYVRTAKFFETGSISTPG